MLLLTILCLLGPVFGASAVHQTGKLQNHSGIDDDELLYLLRARPVSDSADCLETRLTEVERAFIALDVFILSPAIAFPIINMASPSKAVFDSLGLLEITTALFSFGLLNDIAQAVVLSGRSSMKQRFCTAAVGLSKLVGFCASLAFLLILLYGHDMEPTVFHLGLMVLTAIYALLLDIAKFAITFADAEEREPTQFEPIN